MGHPSTPVPDHSTPAFFMLGLLPVSDPIDYDVGY